MILEDLANKGKAALIPQEKLGLRIEVGFGTCGLVAGAKEIAEAFERELSQACVPFHIVPTGCAGLCWAEPLVAVVHSDGTRAVYGNVTPSRVRMILKSELCGTRYERALLELYQVECPPDSNQLTCRMISSCRPSMEVRRISHRCGWIRQASLAEYAATGGYRALYRLLSGDLDAQECIDEISQSSLRGLGGAGFPTGKKLASAFAVDDSVKYVVCNADEGDPGAYMDRSLLEADPHSVIEGLAIEGFCLGAKEGFIFIRSEYKHAVSSLQEAINQAQEAGLLGNNIFGSGWSFCVTVVRSGGTYVCGESSALVNALENKVGAPRAKETHLSEMGLWGHPTCLNNVETLANIPFIIREGAKRFREQGTEENPGTKLFCVTGCNERTGLIELPFGSPLSAVLDTFSQGKASQYKAVQIGGPSGVILPVCLPVYLSFEGLEAHGAIMGSGGIVFLSEKVCVVETVRYFAEFLHRESCGRCPSCKKGLKEALDILTRIVDGKGLEEDLERLHSLATIIPSGSACGLGKAAANALASALRFFHNEFEDHIDGRCKAHVCKNLMHFDIIAKKCPGCRCCLATCPTNAMRGAFGKPFYIDQHLCMKCWMCTSMCPYDAVCPVEGNADESGF